MGKFSLLTTLTLDVTGFNQGLGKASKDTEQFGKALDKVSSFGKSLIGLAGGFLAISSAVDIGKKIINSTSDSADAFEKKMKQAEFVTNAFFQRIATGNFDNLIQGLKDASQAGSDYADILDEIQDRRRSLSVVEAQANFEVLKLKNDLAKTTDKDKRIEIIDQIVAKEKELSRVKTQIAEQQKQADLENLQLNNNFTQQQWDNFIKNYNKEDDLRKQAQEYNTKKSTWDNLAGFTETEKANFAPTSALGKMRDELNATSDIIKMYAATLTAWGEKSDDVIDAYVKSSTDLINVQSEVYANTNKLEKMRSNYANGLDELGRKLDEKNDKAEEDEQQLINLSIAQANYNKLLGDTISRLGKVNAESGLKKTNNVTTTWKPKVANASDELLDMGTTTEEKFKDAKARFEQFNADAGQIVAQGIGNMIGDMALAMGNAMAGGGAADIGKMLLGGLATIAEELGKAAIAFGVTMIAIRAAFKNPYTAIFAGVALLVAAGAMKAKMNQLSKFENGGIIGGSGGYTGDNTIIRANRGEGVITMAHQQKLFNWLNGSDGGNNNGGTKQLEFVIQGDTLRAFDRNYSKKVNTWK